MLLFTNPSVGNFADVCTPTEVVRNSDPEVFCRRDTLSDSIVQYALKRDWGS